MLENDSQDSSGFPDGKNDGDQSCTDQKEESDDYPEPAGVNTADFSA